MRHFNSIFVYLLTTIVCFGIASCSGDDYSSPIKGKTFTDLSFDSSQSTNSITIGDADLTGLTVSSSEPWCVASIQGKNINVTVQSNDTYDDRQAVVTITDSGDQSTASFKVFQNKNCVILTDGSTYQIPEEGGDLNIEVKSNVNYVIEIPAEASWLTKKSSSRGLTSSVVSLTAPKNNSGDEREATVKLTDDSTGAMSQFTVKQGLTPYITLNKEEFTIDESGEEIEVEVSTNIILDSEFDANWISDGGKTEKDDFNFIQKIKVAKLPDNESSRTATVTFTDKSGKWNLKKAVTIKQIKSLTIQDDDIEIYVGDSYSLNLVNNTGGSVSWESSNTSVVTVNDNGKITGISKGTATISVTSADGKYSDEVSVTVKQSISIKEESIELMVGNSYSLNVVNKTGGSLSWTSSNTSVASVNNNGEVTGIGRGSATITATSPDGTLSATCSVVVKDITDFVEAKSGGGSIMMINNLIQYGSSLGWNFINNSDETVRLKSMQLVDGATGNEGNIMSVDTDVIGGSSVSYSTTIGLLGIHIPVTCRFRYEYKGKEYMTTAVFDSLW